jgi:hypothetical protein
MGAERRAHHAHEQAKRDAAAQAAQMEQLMRQQQEAMAKLVEAAKPPVLPEVQAPTPVASTLASAKQVGMTGGVRTAASGRKSLRKTGSGAASLRIPLNVGGAASTTGLNIG